MRSPWGVRSLHICQSNEIFHEFKRQSDRGCTQRPRKLLIDATSGPQAIFHWCPCKCHFAIYE